MAKIGKKVIDDLYIHLSSLEELDNEPQRLRIAQAALCVHAQPGLCPNVAKLNLRTGRLSLLAYLEFDDDPFPELAASWTFAPGSTEAPTVRTYSDSPNPPILHRKELLVQSSHPNRERWARLTATAEEFGLFDDTTTIGFRLNWTRLIESKGYRFNGEDFIPLGNEIERSFTGLDQTGAGPIQRHLTALTRSNLSAPIQLLIRHGFVLPGATVFDYGCGRGGDVSGLNAAGIAAHGWDPYFAADGPTIEADVVNLGFVVNVIEDPAERIDVLHKAFRLARSVMSIGVMLYGNDPPGRPFRDGYITSRNTFQKYFSQAEFKDFIEQVLNQEAFMVGPGVAFAFADRGTEQRFSFGRFQSRDISTRLLAVQARTNRLARESRTPVARPSWRSRAADEFARIQVHLDSLWTTALELGRLPEAKEVRNLVEIEAHVGSLAKAFRLLRLNYDQSLLSVAANTRSDDMRLFMAVQQFSRRRPYGKLEARLQRDIKVFFGDYSAAQGAGRRLLVDAADPDQVLRACQHAAAGGWGWLDNGHSLQLHVSMVERLPAVLRAFVACGLILWNSVSEVQLIKIHITSGKLTLMEFDEFDSSPLPFLRRRIKVNLRKQDYDLFDYGTEDHPKPLLYRKSRYLHENYPGFAEQLAFDEALEATGILGDSDFGPAPSKLGVELELRRLGVSGMRLTRSERVPDLDQACGSNFTYRSFIECGETQRRIGINNLPREPATYNALFDLATQILDPVIDFFGGIRLTYGFCGLELGQHIVKRVAPRLDQHSSYERRRNGKLVCERGGAACDFLVPDEDMYEVAAWVVANTPFDRMYCYGRNLPIHVSCSPAGARKAFRMFETGAGRLVPQRWDS